MTVLFLIINIRLTISKYEATVWRGGSVIGGILTKHGGRGCKLVIREWYLPENTLFLRKLFENFEFPA